LGCQELQTGALLAPLLLLMLLLLAALRCRLQDTMRSSHLLPLES
jgi:hypothetical protein